MHGQWLMHFFYFTPMKKHLLLFSFLLLQLICAAQSADAPSALANFIRTKGDSVYKAMNLPGLFIGVSNGGKRQYFSFGHAIPDTKAKFDSATLFEAGSITKTFTAYLVEAVLDEKGIEDGASILPYLPDSVQANFSLASITFRSLLNHTSGLPRLPLNINLSTTSPYDTYTTSDLFAFLKTAKPASSNNYMYSNLGAGLAGVLASRISGKSYAALLQQYVFKPFNIRTKKPSKKSQGYTDGKKAPYWNMAALAPAGDLDCTASELLDYLTYLSKPAQAPIANRIAKLEAPTKTVNGNVSIGLGWHLVQKEGKPTIYWHNGGTYGFSTFAAYYKKTGQAVVVVINQFNKNGICDELGVSIMKKMLN